MRNFTILRVWGIPIRVNVSLLVFLPVLAYLIGSGQQIELYASIIDSFTAASLDVGALRAGNTPWLIGVLAGLGLFVSVTLHELGHSWVALRYGIEIDSITLWIFGGIASLRTIPREWNREFFIAIAGPLTSVGLGVVCFLAVGFVPESVPVAVFLVGWLALANVSLAIFNMVPAFPMDGGRILRALLARSRPYGTATRIASRVGVGFALIFAILGVLAFDIILILVALFVYGAATSESRVVALQDMLDGLTVGDLMRRDPPTVEADETVRDLFERMLRERVTTFPVLQGGRIVGVVSMTELRGTDPADRDTVRIGDIAREDLRRFDAAEPAFETLAALQSERLEFALVEDRGSVVGVVSPAEFGAALQLRDVMGREEERRDPDTEEPGPVKW